ncbi:MAG: IS200/IS605 family transposase [Verrucomicrobia bacterium]|nr:IS200/IS605 family transposase [Verrucomicrobiota bacterium]
MLQNRCALSGHFNHNVMPQSIHVLFAHVIFSTKERRPWLRNEIRPKLFAYMATILRDKGCRDVLIDGHDDHVHILCNLSKQHPTAKILETVKKESSKWLKREFFDFGNFHWQDGYGLFGVSPSHVAAVRKYVASQEEHHRRVSFQDELRRILGKNGVEINEPYLWE